MSFRSNVAVLAAAIALASPVTAASAQTKSELVESQSLTTATFRRVIEVRFDAPPVDIIPLLLTRVDLFDPTIAEVRFDHSESITPGELNIGSRRICIFTDGRELVEPILVYNPPHTYAYTVDAEASTMTLPVSDIVLSYAFEPDGDGSLLTVSAFYDPSIPGTGPVIEPVLTGTLRRTFQTAADVFGGAYLGDAKP
ncbi:MAG: SRPBCC family protein [Pseudomonadota bacterium]